MKFLCVIILSAAVSLHASAQQAETVKWYSIEEALKLNEKTPRNILIDVYTDWCGWCK